MKQVTIAGIFYLDKRSTTIIKVLLIASVRTYHNETDLFETRLTISYIQGVSRKCDPRNVFFNYDKLTNFLCPI